LKQYVKKLLKMPIFLSAKKRVKTAKIRLFWLFCKKFLKTGKMSLFWLFFKEWIITCVLHRYCYYRHIFQKWCTKHVLMEMKETKIYQSKDIFSKKSIIK
jgi:hypothetical protein